MSPDLISKVEKLNLGSSADKSGSGVLNCSTLALTQTNKHAKKTSVSHAQKYFPSGGVLEDKSLYRRKERRPTVNLHEVWTGVIKENKGSN